MVKIEVLKALENNRGNAISGEYLAKSLNVTRTAIWKSIKSLKDDGYRIATIKGKGYLLSESSSKISAEGIKMHLIKDIPLHMYNTVDSTNNVAMTLASQGAPHGSLVIAEEQSKGKGRRGRSFYSPPDTGIYMSIIIKPEMDIEHSLLITSAAAVSVAEAIDKVCLTNCQIKWVNDIYLRDKKICGILTEAITDFENGQVSNIVVGIGINCSTENFTADIVDSAGSISTESFDRNKLIAVIANTILSITADIKNGNVDFMDAYRKKSLVIGKEIQVYKSINLDPKMGVSATALDIDDRGSLVVKYKDGSKETLSSGEISIRL